MAANWQFFSALYFSISSSPAAAPGASTSSGRRHARGECSSRNATQALDPRLHLGRRPVFEQPVGQRVPGSADLQRLVLVGPTFGEQLQRVRQFVIDFERVAVRVGEVEAALVDVVGGAQDLDPAADEVSVGLAQGRIAADLESDVSEPDLPPLRSLRGFGSRMLSDVERVEIVAQGHEHAAVLGVFLGDNEPEQIAVEPLRDLLVGDPQIDVADALQFDHVVLCGLSPSSVTEVMRAALTPQGKSGDEKGTDLLLST